MMTNSELLNGHGVKHYKSEFIFKLIEIMKNFPKLVNWTIDGTGIQFFQINQIQRTILPYYFRHSNFQSFLRQLHLYNFRQNKSLKKQFIFQHSIFKRGNESQFFMIQRIRHKKQKQSLLKELENNDILKQIQQNPTLDANQKYILKTLISFKFIILEKQKVLKQKLNEFTEALKSNHSKNVKPNLQVLEEQIKLEMGSNKKFGKSIDIFLTETLNERIIEYQSKTLKSDNILNEEKEKLQKLSIQGQIKQNKECQSLGNIEAFQFWKGLQNNSQGLCPSDSQKIGSMNYSSLQISLFNFQREPQLIFMPLPVYNKSVMSEFFDRANQSMNTDFGTNQKVEEKIQINQLKSKSEEFETTGTGMKIIQLNEENILDGKDDSEISFMNEAYAN